MNGTEISAEMFFHDIFQKFLEQNKRFKKIKKIEYNQSEWMTNIIKEYERRRGQKDIYIENDGSDDEEDGESEEYYDHSGSNPTNRTSIDTEDSDAGN